MAYNTYFRLSKTGARVPKHWAYSEAWEQDAEGWVDNRGVGFQVWSKLSSVILTLAGHDRDGIYSAEEYPVLLLVRPSDVSDSSGEWYAVDPNDVRTSRALRSKSALKLVLSAYQEAGGEAADWRAIEEWVEDNQEPLVKMLWAAARPVKLRPVETLPKPRTS